MVRWPGGDRFGLAAAPLVDGHWLLPSRVRSGVAPAVDQVVDRILSPVPQAHATRLTTAQDVTTQLSLVLGPMSASHDLRARLHPSEDPDAAPAPVSTVAPPVPTPASSRYVVTSAVDLDDEPGDETEPFVDAALSHGESFTPVPPPATTAAPVTVPPSAAARGACGIRCDPCRVRGE